VSESVTQNELNALLLWTNSVHLTTVDYRALSHTYSNRAFIQTCTCTH